MHELTKKLIKSTQSIWTFGHIVHLSYCTQCKWCKRWKPRGLDRERVWERVSLIAPDRPRCTEIRQTRTDSSACERALEEKSKSLYESESLYMYEQDNEQANSVFFSSSPLQPTSCSPRKNWTNEHATWPSPVPQSEGPWWGWLCSLHKANPQDRQISAGISDTTPDPTSG